MSAWAVNLVSAFGRGELLALALQENGFDVRVLDFTPALAVDQARGAGPFPLSLQTFLPVQKLFLEEARPLSRGLTFWLHEGPLELGGPMAAHFLEEKVSFQNLQKGLAPSAFEQDWLRRFLLQWASPYQSEPWMAQKQPLFPYEEALGLIPSTTEERVMSFERFQALDYAYFSCTGMHDIRSEGSRLLAIELDTGRSAALEATQWIWCLSGEETERISPKVAATVFTRGVRPPQWRWARMDGQCLRGPWCQGFPRYFVLIGDIRLPWVYANTAIMRFVEADRFQVWLKVPADTVASGDQRRTWAKEVLQHLHARLPQGKWALDADAWAVCPHSPVYDIRTKGENMPSWKNWDWIAPETLPRLDLSARLERESSSYHRMIDWRSDQLKKQGAQRDSTLHTS